MKVEMNNKSNIGKAFSERFKEFSIEPAPEVWENVNSRIPSASPNPFLSKGFLIGVGAVVVLTVATIFYVQNKKLDKSQPGENMVTTEKVMANPNPHEKNTVKTPIIKSVEKQQQTKEKKTPVTKIDKETSSNKDKVNNDVVVIKKNSSKSVTTDSQKPEPPSTLPDIQSTEDNQEAVSKDNSPVELPIEASTPQKRDSIKFSNDPIICFGEDAYLEVFGGEYYRWNNGDIMSKTVVHPVANTNYSVTVTDKYGSEYTHVFHVAIDKECTTVSVPSAFTPNADGNNDLFKVYGENIAAFKMQILNRQGQLLFTSTDINQGWDGMYNGELQPSQVYIYTIIYTNGRGIQNIKKGQFTLLK